MGLGTGCGDCACHSSPAGPHMLDRGTYTDRAGDPTRSRVYRLLLQPLCALKTIPKQNVKEESPLTSLVLVMVSAMMLAAPGSSVTGINGREEAEEADGVTAEGVTASSEETI